MAALAVVLLLVVLVDMSEMRTDERRSSSECGAAEEKVRIHSTGQFLLAFIFLKINPYQGEKVFVGPIHWPMAVGQWDEAGCRPPSTRGATQAQNSPESTIYLPTPFSTRVPAGYISEI